MGMMLARRWWLVALRGIAAIAFGFLTFVAPGSSLLALMIIFGAFALVDGAFNISLAIRSARGDRRWGSLLFQGVAGVVAGVLTFIWPGMSALVLLLIIAAWAVVTGVATVVAAIRLRRTMTREWLLAISGLFSVAFGVLLFLFPGAGALTLVIWIGAYAFVYGVLLLVLAFRLRAFARSSADRTVPTGGAHAPA